MLNITSINEDGLICHRNYNIKTCKFYNIDGSDININIDFGDHHTTPPSGGPEPLPEEEWKRLSYNRSSSEKYHDVSLLKIQMGLSCNYRCGYCIQGGCGTTDITKNDDVDRFIDNFDSWCTTRKDQNIHIQLWGGEPLLYPYALRRLIGYFKSRFDKSSISVVSNGSLFNKDFADFFLTNNIEYVVSHDGPTQLLGRTGDPLSGDSESLKWIKYYANNESRKGRGMAFNSVITKNNLDIKSVITYIKGIVGDNAKVNFEGIVTVEDINKFDDTSLFTEKDYFILRENILSLLRDGTLKDVGPFNMKFGSIISSWFSKDFSIGSDSFQKCAMDNPYTMAVDLKGNVLKCHSNPETIGRTSNIDSIDLYKNITRWTQRPGCNECLVLSLCRGACMIVDDKSWGYTCSNEFNFNMAIFEAAFEYIFRERILQIDYNIGEL